MKCEVLKIVGEILEKELNKAITINLFISAKLEDEQRNRNRDDDTVSAVHFSSLVWTVGPEER